MSLVDNLVDSRSKQEIVDCCRRSVQYGLNFNTQGNISVRVPDSGLLAITPAGGAGAARGALPRQAPCA
jgi:ribulose-5-phosphate 4-epimerase/fuculose-1-phosphate aldolase